MPAPRAALLLALAVASRPCLVPQVPTTALEVGPFEAWSVDMDRAPTVELHASAAGLTVRSASLQEIAFGFAWSDGRPTGPGGTRFVPFDWCASRAPPVDTSALTTAEYVVITVDDGVPYDVFVRLLDEVKRRGERKILLAGGPTEARVVCPAAGPGALTPPATSP